MSVVPPSNHSRCANGLRTPGYTCDSPAGEPHIAPYVLVIGCAWLLVLFGGCFFLFRQHEGARNALHRCEQRVAQCFHGLSMPNSCCGWERRGRRRRHASGDGVQISFASTDECDDFSGSQPGPVARQHEQGLWKVAAALQKC